MHFIRLLGICWPGTLFLVFIVHVSILSESDHTSESDENSYSRNTEAQI